MNNNFKKAATLTIVASMVYSLILTFIQFKYGHVPSEHELHIVLLHGEKVFKLPYSVSLWWGLLCTPITLMFLVGYQNSQEIVGKKPGYQSAKITQLKYSVREHVVLSNYVASLFIVYITSGICFMTICIKLCLGFEDVNFGLLNGLVMSLYFFFLMVAVSLVVEMFDFMSKVLSPYSWEKEDLIELYQNTMIILLKKHPISGIPMMVSYTLGYILVVCIRVPINVIYGLKLAFKNEDVAQS